MFNKYFFALQLILSVFVLQAQTCIPGYTEFSRQSQIDSFLIDNPTCTDIEGFIAIYDDGDGINNITDLSAFINLRSLWGLDISNNPWLTSLSGLDSLEKVSLYGDGTLTISNNQALTSLEGLNNLRKTDFLNITNDSLLVDLTPLSNLDTIIGSIRIDDNALLSDIAGLDDMDMSNVYDLYINRNPNLAYCHITSVCDFLDMPYAYAEFSLNASGCEDLLAVQTNCAGGPLSCVNMTWTGATNNDWHEPTNWNSGSVPSICDTAIIADAMDSVNISGLTATPSKVINYGSLVIDENLVIRNSTSESIDNHGTIVNNDSLMIYNSDKNGIYNAPGAILHNYGLIRIDTVRGGGLIVEDQPPMYNNPALFHNHANARFEVRHQSDPYTTFYREGLHSGANVINEGDMYFFQCREGFLNHIESDFRNLPGGNVTFDDFDGIIGGGGIGFGFFNSGICHNHDTMKCINSVGGVNSSWQFYNEPSGVIQILGNGDGNGGLSADGLFENEGVIELDNVGEYNIFGGFNSAVLTGFCTLCPDSAITFHNMPTGSIKLSNIGGRGIENYVGRFLNQGTILIDSTVSTGFWNHRNSIFVNKGDLVLDKIGDVGIINGNESLYRNKFENTETGTINIIKSFSDGIYNHKDSTSFINNGMLTIGLSEYGHGINNAIGATFCAQDSSQVNIDSSQLASVMNGGVWFGQGAISVNDTFVQAGYFSSAHDATTMALQGIFVHDTFAVDSFMMRDLVDGGHDSVFVQGDVRLRGTLHISLFQNFMPDSTMKFVLIEYSGQLYDTFDSIEFPTELVGWSIDYGKLVPGKVILLNASGLHPDFIALMTMYHALNGPNWTDNSGWVDGVAFVNGDPCSGWAGVTCNSDRVIDIEMNNDNSITGQLPEVIGQLTMLETLNLASNNIAGSLPQSIGFLDNISTVQLQNNNIGNCFPTSYFRLCDVVTDFSGNSLPSFMTFCSDDGVGACPDCINHDVEINDVPIEDRTFLKVDDDIISGGLIEATSKVLLHAETSVLLGNNFEIEAGGELRIEIIDCP